MKNYPLYVIGIIGAVAMVACTSPTSSNSGGTTTPTTTPTTTKTPPPAAVSLPPATASVTYTPGTKTTASIGDSTTKTSVNFSLPANLLSSNSTVNFTTVSQSAVPARAATAQPTFITAFKIDVGGSVVTTFNVPLPVGGTAPSTVPPGATLNIALLSASQWVDVGTFVVSSGGAFTQNLPTTQLPGVIGAGTYLIYLPATGTSSSVSNLGLALLADDGHGSGSSAQALQVVHLFDASGTPLATPTVSYLSFPSAYDMDGQALTPDGSQGIIVDGGNTVRFFGSVQTGTPIASTKTLDITSYGGDGDAVAILKNGDEAVVSGDGSTSLVVISGISTGNPVVASTIPINGYRDGLVISGDEKVLLARGPSALTVFSIASVSPTAGTLGGTLTHTFTQKVDLTSTQVGSAPYEDGRDGMALSPVDSTRAVVISYNQVRLLTNLTTSPSVGTAVNLPVNSSAYSVAISQDGKKAVIGTTNGILLYSGVDTGALSLVGTGVFSPSYGSGYNLATVRTLAITLDNQYVVACDGSNSALVVIPFSSTGFSAPVGVLTGVAVPDNDQLLLH